MRGMEIINEFKIMGFFLLRLIYFFYCYMFDLLVVEIDGIVTVQFFNMVFCFENISQLFGGKLIILDCFYFGGDSNFF